MEESLLKKYFAVFVLLIGIHEIYDIFRKFKTKYKNKKGGKK